MKKIILSILALVMSASMVFGHNQVGDLMDTLTVGNQFKARLDQVGILAGTDMLRFSVGATLGSKIFDNGADNKIRLSTSPFVSVGYKTPAFGVALGYQFYNVYKTWTMHAPGLALTFMNNNLRILVPFRVGMGNKDNAALKNVSAFDLGPDGVWVRYHTGVEMLPQVRLYVNYGSVTFGKDSAYTVDKALTASSLGLQLRVYFKKFMAGDVGIQPVVRVYFDTSMADLKNSAGDWEGSSYSIRVNSSGFSGSTPATVVNTNYKNPMHIQVRFPVEFTAANDILDFYIAPDLRFDMVTGKTDADTAKKNAAYSLGYNFYSEINFYATKTLSFYLESEVGGNMTGGAAFLFAANAGMTWKF